MKNDHKFALITGGTKGIGKAVAKILSSKGYDLILTYASDDKTAHQVETAFAAEGKEVTLLKADASKISSIDLIANFLDANALKLDVVILNAGTTCRDSFEEMKMEDWTNVFMVNVHFPVFLLQRILSRINKGGSVVFTGSLMGNIPHSVSLSYGVTKSAVHSLVRNLVKFLAPKGIRVNGVAPGFVDTEWQKTKPAAIRKNIENKVSLGCFCDPDELAKAYLMLIENNYFNGEVIVLDGGYSYK
ncbi:MAG: SDR family oxidoreductase [Massilibacteroides sp.]|nr:SDR family oxidoreductase [Massilibacteroides sp.]